jgi:hypothetical protein
LKLLIGLRNEAYQIQDPGSFTPETNSSRGEYNRDQLQNPDSFTPETNFSRGEYNMDQLQDPRSFTPETNSSRGEYNEGSEAALNMKLKSASP